MKTIDLNKTEWKQQNIKHLVKQHAYLEYWKQRDLRLLILCPPEDKENENLGYTEIKFVVPTPWLKSTVAKLFNETDLIKWLKDVYTSEESEIILAQAIAERQVVMIDFE